VSVASAGGQHYDWVRLTYPRGRVDAAYGDGHGWILPVPSWFLPNRERVFAPLSELRDEPVIVLAAASGIGKSTALEQEHQALTPAASCLVDLKTAAGRHDPVAYLSEKAKIPAQVPEGTWHVLLDGFDEAVIRRPEFADLLDQWLAEHAEPGRLRLRLATRPGVMQNNELEEVLRRRWPAEGAVTVRDMAPLNRSDVLQAAEERSLADPEGFTAELEQRGLVPVANLPVTLKALLEQAAQRRPFPKSATEVYQLAVEYLCAEPGPGRPPPTGPGLKELTRHAGYLAAVLEFCGNGVLTDELDPVPGGPVRLVDVADVIGPETGKAEEALKWLTATPLLRSLSGKHWQFAHEGIQAFLAASCLADRELAPASVLSLLFAGHGQDRYVHPAHRDVAGWLAWHQPGVYKEILNRDPAALLSPDLPAQPAAVREEVVEALFAAAARSGDITRLQVLHRADHPGLRAQLVARITPEAARRAGTEPQPLMMALALAQACPDYAPAGNLLDVAEDDWADAAVRAAAVETVPSASVAAVAGRLEALTHSLVPEVAAAALLALWPGQLPTAGLLDRFPASVAGSYWRQVETRLRAADAGEVTAWMRRQFKDGTVNSATRVLQLVEWTSRAVRPDDGEQAQQPATGQLAEVLALLLGSDHAHGIELVDVRATWAAYPAWRRLLASETLAHLTGEDTAALAAAQYGELGLVPPEDSIYWARRVAAGDAGVPAALTSLSLSYPGNVPELDQVRGERRASRRLEEVTAHWFAPEPAWRREAEQEAARHRAEIASKLEELAAERPAQGEIRSWWATIIWWLARNPSAFDLNPVSVRLTLTALPSCPEDDSALRLALRDAARHAVENAPVVAAGNVASVVDIADACEVTALALIDGTLDLTAERWAGFALVLAFANGDATDQEEHASLLTHSAAAGGLILAGELPAALSAVAPMWAAKVVTTLAQAELGHRVDEAVLAWADAPGRPTGAWCDAMQSLAPCDRRSLPVLGRLSEIAGRGLPPDDAGARQRWAQAVDLMLLHGPHDDITARWDQVLSSEEATSAWAEIAEEPGTGFSMHARSPVTYWPAAYRWLAPRQAAELYRRLARRGLVDFPRPGRAQDIAGPGRRGIHSRLPELIAEHLTEDASGELQALAVQFPDHPGLTGLAASHARWVGENLPPLTLAEFTRLVTDVTTRIVRNVADLTRVVLDALDTLQEQALQSHGWSTLMWNREDEQAQDGWWPTWEDNLSNLLCAFLREHLAGQKPVINREVEIQPSRLDGGRTDVLIQAADPRDAAPQPLTVIIEVKGCWNPEISTGIGQQLAPYLQPRPGWAGIFLVGYFHAPGREHERYTGTKGTAGKTRYRRRHRTRQGHTAEQVLADLCRQQAAAAAADIHVRVLRLPLVLPPATAEPL
jgi:hypothetical protein